MGWDVFISHASEDKQAVAVPLKKALEELGISVWIDIEQIKLGDGLRTRIDAGLQRCKFGVVILSPRFFKKPWAKAELDAFFAMEMASQNVRLLLPIVHDMSFEDLRKESPMLAGRKAVRWEDGIAAVVEAIAEVVTGFATSNPTPAVAPTTSTQHQRHGNLKALVFFLLQNGRMAYVESERIDSGSNGLEMILKCSDADDTALVHELENGRNHLIALAFGTTAVLGRVMEARLQSLAGVETGVVKIKPERQDIGIMGEVAYGSFSADKIAEMRVRRILLNEAQQGSTGKADLDSINAKMLDVFVTGMNTSIKVTQSPIPELYKATKAYPELFIALARLAAVLYMRLSHTIEHILKFDLNLKGETLHVEFSGRRPKRFTNVEPPLIDIHGDLDLSK